MSRRRWNQFPQVYAAILRHFEYHAEEVWIEGLDAEDAGALRTDFNKFLKALSASEDDEAKRLDSLAREVMVEVQDGSLVIRMNALALALRAPEVRQIEEEITYYEGEEAFDPNALEELIKQKEREDG